MTSIFDKNLLPQFESVKNDGEEFFWIGKPKFLPFILKELLYALIGALGIGAIFFYNYTISKNEGEDNLSFIVLVLLTFFILPRSVFFFQ